MLYLEIIILYENLTISSLIEITNCDKKIIEFINTKLLEGYKNPKTDTKSLKERLLSMEGNVWEIMKRLKKRYIKEKKEEIPSNNNTPVKNFDQLKEDESSWKNSSDESEVEEVMGKLSNSRKTPQQVQSLRRSSTYHLRKENMINNLNKSSECALSLENSESDSDEEGPVIKVQNIFRS